MTLWPWACFTGLIALLLALDLGFVHRRKRAPSIPEAVGWSAFWIALALLFNAALYYLYRDHGWGFIDVGSGLSGAEAALQFFTGWLVEKSLSLHNIFVLATIFAYFRVGARDQQRLLWWGLLVALVLRAMMIVAGVTLIARLPWIAYVLGVFLILTAAKVLVVRHDNLEPERNLLIRLTRRILPARLSANPFLLPLVMIAGADLLFAIDSIPAILAVTRDPFLIVTSNAFAVLGLRSLYFVLTRFMDRLRYVRISLVFLLAFVGVKMLLSPQVTIHDVVALAVITVILAVGILASLLDTPRDPAAAPFPLAEELSGLARLTYRSARRVVVLAFGSTVLLIGAALLVLPGPGFPIVFLGLAILATEFVWARALLKRARSEAHRLALFTRSVLDRRRR